MKYDVDLERAILLAIEECPDEALPTEPLISGWSNKEVNYHLQLLFQDVYINAIEFKGGGQISYAKIGLTRKGHQLLDQIREQPAWERLKGLAQTAAGTVTLATIQEVVISLVKQRAGLP